jgi:nitrous oxide reductase accessory protein NosL
MKRLIALALLAGCGAPEAGPVPIALGEDDCALCRMFISEAAYAAQARFEGRVEKYDDIGCLGERLAEGAAPKENWVADHGTLAWVDARAAVYVHAKELKTPMASGLAAFAARADAEAFAAKAGGRLLTLDQVKELRRPR